MHDPRTLDPVRPGDSDDLVRAELLRIVYRHAKAAVLVNTVVAGVVTVEVWGSVPHATLLVWLTSVTLVTLGRGALWLAYRHRERPPSDSLFWGRALVAGTSLSAAVWGSASVLLLPWGGIAEQLGVTVTVVGLTAGVAISAASYLPVIVAFLAISLTPYIVAFALAGTVFHGLVAVLIVIYTGGTAFVARGNAEMIRELITLRLAVVQQRDAVTRASVAKSTFLAAASHDLRQPLHALTLFVGALDHRLKDGESRQILGQVQGSLTAMRSLFDALLDVSRLDAGIVEPRVETFDLRPMLERLAAEYEPQAADKGLAWRCVSTSAVVRSDPVLLERILRNLLSNAVRYTNRGEVGLECTRQGPRLAITVADTGIGIPKERQQEVFLEFHQLDNPERDRTKGLGLGLAIVDRLARLLGHDLALDSEPGRGSRLTVHVPAGDPTDLRSAVATDSGAISDLAGLRVLVIDDDAAIREGMAHLLRTWQCIAVLASSEEEAVRAVLDPDGPPDVLVADYRLWRGAVGTQVLERLWRQLGRRLPALLVTGDTAPERLREAGASGHALLHKPVPPARLRAFLRHARQLGGVT